MKEETKENPKAKTTITIEAKTFKLKVCNNNGILSIGLDDLQEYVKYFKDYSGQCSWLHGTETIITSLDEIFDILTSTETPEGSNTDSGEEELTKDYEHNVAVKRRGAPCFKVGRGGKIQFYFVITKQRNKKQYIFQADFSLSKVQDMTEQEIQQQKSWKKTQQLLKQVHKLKKQLASKSSELCRLKAKNQKVERAEKSMNGFILTNVAHSNWQSHTFNKIVPYGETYSFKIKILAMNGNCDIAIGVVDLEKYKKNAGCIYDTNDAVSYFCTGKVGYKHPGAVPEGFGYNNNEIIEVVVDLMKKKISWMVKNIVRATHTCEILGDVTRIFVPYIQYYHGNTQLQWIDQ